MGVLDAALRQVTKDVLDTFGTSATIRRQASTFTAATATATQTNTDYTVKVRPERYRAHEIDGDRVQPGDLRVLVPAQGLDITPKPVTDQLIIGGVTHSVIDVQRVIATDQAAAYELQARVG